MPQSIGYVGGALRLPTASYPQIIGVGGTISANPNTNNFTLPPGGNVLIPPGIWWINCGQVCQLQALDPVTNTWLPQGPNSNGEGTSYVDSDGVNFRLYNPTGFPGAAIVTNAGTGYTSAPTVTAGTGSSTWISLIGGSISAINVNNNSSGANYSVPPLVFVAAPASPGIPCTAVASISGGTVSLISVTNPGSGYGTSAPAVVLVPQNSDLNLASTSTTLISNAAATAVTSFVGQVTSVLLTNEGNNPLTAAPALSFAGGAGSNAAATALMQTVIGGYTVTTTGSGYPASPIQIMTIGGSVLQLTSGTPASGTTGLWQAQQLTVRQAVIVGKTSGGVVAVNNDVNGGIISPGIWTQPPQAFVIPAGSGGLATVALTVASGTQDTVYMQQAVAQ